MTSMQPRSVKGAHKAKLVEPEAVDSPSTAPDTPMDDDATETLDESNEENLDPRVAKLRALQRRRQQAQLDNRKDVRTEHNKQKYSAQETKRLERKRQKAMLLEEKVEAAETGEDLERKRNWDYTIEDNDRWNKKLDRKRSRGQYEFTDYDDAARRKYKKDLDQLKPDLAAYNKQKAAILGDVTSTDLLDPSTGAGNSEVVARANEMLYRDANSFVYADHKPSEDAIDRVIGQLNSDIDKRNKRSRVRKEDESEDVTYINQANKSFNKKLSRFYDQYTTETRNAFERGTAL